VPPLGNAGLKPQVTAQPAAQFATSQPLSGHATVQSPFAQSTAQLSAPLHSTVQSAAPAQLTSTVPPVPCTSQEGAPLQSTEHGSPLVHWVSQSAAPEHVISQASLLHTQSSASHTFAPPGSVGPASSLEPVEAVSAPPPSPEHPAPPIHAAQSAIRHQLPIVHLCPDPTPYRLDPRARP
jgi:hypothetical protein